MAANLGMPGSGTKSPVQKELPGADTHLPHTSGLPEPMMELSASFSLTESNNQSHRHFWALYSSQEEKEEDYRLPCNQGTLPCIFLFGLGRKGGAFLLDHLVSLLGPHFLGSREQHLLWSVETSYREEKLSCDLELLLRG